MSRTKSSAAAAIAAGLLLLGACGGSSEGASEPSATTAPGTSAADAPDATDAPAATTTVAAGAGAAVPSPGCSAEPGPPVEVEQRFTIDVDGTERFYLLTAPTTTNAEPQPLIVDYHGLSEGSTIHALMSGLSALAEQEGFVVAFPNGTGTPVGWAATDKDPNGDQAFTAAMLDRLGEEQCIDLSRIYATGLSNGAFMTSAVACGMADRFAAVAPVAGVVFVENCRADRPVPLLTFHGTDDPILLFNGGVDGDYLGSVLDGEPTSDDPTATTPPRPYDIEGEGYPAAVRGWADHNGCEPEPADTQVSETVLHRVYDCPTGAAVEFYVIEGGGHSWPGSDFSKSIESIVGPTTFDIDASQLMWEFFQRFQLPEQ